MRFDLEMYGIRAPWNEHDRACSIPGDPRIKVVFFQNIAMARQEIVLGPSAGDSNDGNH